MHQVNTYGCLDRTGVRAVCATMSSTSSRFLIPNKALWDYLQQCPLKPSVPRYPETLDFSFPLTFHPPHISAKKYTDSSRIIKTCTVTGFSKIPQLCGRRAAALRNTEIEMSLSCSREVVTPLSGGRPGCGRGGRRKTLAPAAQMHIYSRLWGVLRARKGRTGARNSLLGTGFQRKRK